MAQYKRRNGKYRRKRQEATIVGDLFRILFAVSMLIVAILAAFFVMKNVTGFSLPDLKQTLQTESSAPVTVRVEETTAAPVRTTAESKQAESKQAESSSAEESVTMASVTETETKTQEVTTEAVSAAHDPQESTRARQETQRVESGDARYESPVTESAESTQSLGPGFEIDEKGPVGAN